MVMEHKPGAFYTLMTYFQESRCLSPPQLRLAAEFSTGSNHRTIFLTSTGTPSFSVRSKKTSGKLFSSVQTIR